MLRRVGSARAWKGSSCVSMYIHYHAYNGASRSARFFRDLHCGLRDTSRHSLQQVNLLSSNHLQCPASQPRMPARKSSNGVLSPRLVRNSKSRQRLREPLLAGFELLHGRFTLSRLYAAQGSRPRREAARAFSPNQTRLLGKPVRPRAATCRSRSARRRLASRHRRVRAGRSPAYR